MITLRMRLQHPTAPDAAQTPAERHRALEVQAGDILREVREGVSQIGSGRMAGQIVGDIRGAVDKAMADAKSEIAGATTELVAVIRDGAKNVKKAIQAETMHVQQEFSTVIGNAAAAAEEAVAEVKAGTEAAKSEALK